MADLATLQAQRDRLTAARYTGALSFRDQNGEEIVYKSDAQMRAALAALDAEIGRLSAAPPSTITFRTSKGL